MRRLYNPGLPLVGDVDAKDIATKSGDAITGIVAVNVANNLVVKIGEAIGKNREGEEATWEKWVFGAFGSTVAQLATAIFLLPKLPLPWMKDNESIAIAQGTAYGMIAINIIRNLVDKFGGATLQKVKSATLGDWKSAMGFPSASLTGMLPSRRKLIVGDYGGGTKVRTLNDYRNFSDIGLQA